MNNAWSWPVFDAGLARRCPVSRQLRLPLSLLNNNEHTVMNGSNHNVIVILGGARERHTFSNVAIRI
ncbi:MAG: hypothetical protein ACP5O7_01705 [Phycisphaerae bacterium]